MDYDAAQLEVVLHYIIVAESLLKLRIIIHFVVGREYEEPVPQKYDCVHGGGYFQCHESHRLEVYGIWELF